jgi:hypothetical protein
MAGGDNGKKRPAEEVPEENLPMRYRLRNLG